MSDFCQVRRWDVDPSCDPYGGQYVQPTCDHAVCREDIRLHGLGYQHEWSLWDCPSGQCALSHVQAQCDLDAGHEGPHLWPEAGEMTLDDWTNLPTPALVATP